MRPGRCLTPLHNALNFWRPLLAQLRRALPPGVLIIALGLIYLTTLAPGLTWANRGADGGDLITAAATNGVAHPPGNPTYLALARLFQYLPLGGLAFRTNLFSSVCAAQAALVVYDLVRRSQLGPAQFRHVSGLIASFGYGLSPLLWSQAVITKVYALHALFVALILWFMPLDVDAAQERRIGMDRIGGLLFGLALGNHLTIALLLPPWLLIGTRQLQWRSLARRLGWLAFGLLIYLTLPLRALADSPVNWGDPASWDGFWWLVSGQLYQEQLFSLPAAFVFPRVQTWSALLLNQFGFLGLILGLYGLFFGRPTSTRSMWIIGWTMLAFTVFAIGYEAYDSYAYLIPAFLAFAIWLGWGAAAVLAMVHRRAPWLVPAAGNVFLLLIFAHASLSLPDVDASSDTRAETFGRAGLASAPADALVFTEGDEATFALWYFHFALQARPDIVVLSEGLLPFEWYRAGLHTTYPALVVPAHASTLWQAAIVAANSRPVCQAQADTHAELICTP